MPIRDLTPADLDSALVLNNAAVPAVNPHDATSWTRLLKLADRSWVVDDDGVLGGLLVAFGPGSSYASANYRWLDERFDGFRYVDRIIIGPRHQRRGLGSQLYAALEAHARDHGAQRLLCEVNVQPPNPQSVAFHTRSGWTAIEDRRLGPDKAVRYFERSLA